MTPPPISGFEVKLEYPVLGFLYGFCPVYVVINGTKMLARWGTQFYPAGPGRYNITCFTHYLITPQAGMNSMEGDLFPGQVIRVTWKMSHIVFLKGPMRWELISDPYAGYVPQDR